MSDRACTLVMAYLRSHAGAKLAPWQIAGATRLPTRIVSNVLTTRYSRNTPHLQRERLRGDPKRGWVWWITDTEDAQGLDGLAKAIARWFMRHRRAARPTVIAAALRADVAAVSAQLEQWAAQGDAVRCELLTRSGFDRFEYRLSEFLSDHFSGQRNPSFADRILSTKSESREAA